MSVTTETTAIETAKIWRSIKDLTLEQSWRRLVTIRFDHDLITFVAGKATGPCLASSCTDLAELTNDDVVLGRGCSHRVDVHAARRLLFDLLVDELRAADLNDTYRGELPSVKTTTHRRIPADPAEIARLMADKFGGVDAAVQVWDAVHDELMGLG